MFNNKNFLLVLMLMIAAIYFSSCASTFYTPLQQAAMKGDVKKVQELLDKGANVNEWKWGTPLMFAASEGKLEVVKLLVSRKAEVNATSQGGWTALGWAAMNGHQDIVDFLIISGADVSLAANGLQKMRSEGYGKADKIDSGMRLIYERQGWAFYQSGKYEKAVETFKQMVSKEANADNLIGLSYSYYGLGKYDDAIAAAQIALKVKSDHPYAHFALGQGFMAKSNWPEGIDSLKKAVELAPENAMLHWNLGIAYSLSGKYEEAINSLEKAVSLAPTNLNPLLGLMVTYVRAGRWDEAAKAADQAMVLASEIDRKAYIIAWKAMALREKGSQQEALSELQKALSLKPEHDSVRTARGALELDKGNYEEAINQVKEVKDSSVARILEASAYARQGKFKEAGDIYSLILDEAATATNALVIRNFQKLQELLRPQVEALLENARKLEASGKAQEAYSEYSQALRLAEAARAKEIRASVASFLKTYPQYLEIPEEARRYTLRADVLIKEKKHDEALKEYQNALRMAPLTPVLYYTGALVLAELKNYRRATDYMNVYLELYPDAPNARQAKDEIYKWEFQLEREGKK
jgi:tetratricopeptide (TPR) repeat protein